MNKNVKTHATGARRKIAGRSHYRAGPLAARSPSQEGCRRGPFRRKRPDIADPAAPRRPHAHPFRPHLTEAWSARRPPGQAVPALPPAAHRCRSDV